jgi:hypothetical protein
MFTYVIMSESYEFSVATLAKLCCLSIRVKNRRMFAEGGGRRGRQREVGEGAHLDGVDADLQAGGGGAEREGAPAEREREGAPVEQSGVDADLQAGSGGAE